MKNILVTGANGFIGKNIITYLRSYKEYAIFEYDINNNNEELVNFIKKTDFIFHFAGVNRPNSNVEFEIGNTNFTQHIVDLLIKFNKRTPILFSSSIQVEKNNHYGQSKKAAEEILLEFSKEYDCEVFIFRLPNIFGKWSRPNYNSVVATFCHNISRNIDITISDKNYEIELAYIDDIVLEFYKILIKKIKQKKIYYKIPKTYKTTLGKLADIIRYINEIKNTLIVPDLSCDFTKKLHATYLSYLSSDDFSYTLSLHKDKRGDLFELIKSKTFGQVFISTTKPGITRGNHYHHTKYEKFCVIRGQATIKFRHLINNEIIEYNVDESKPTIVDIAPGYTHSITNTGDSELITLFWACEIFDNNKPDTYFEEV